MQKIFVGTFVYFLNIDAIPCNLTSPNTNTAQRILIWFLIFVCDFPFYSQNQNKHLNWDSWWRSIFISNLLFFSSFSAIDSIGDHRNCYIENFVLVFKMITIWLKFFNVLKRSQFTWNTECNQQVFICFLNLIFSATQRKSFKRTAFLYRITEHKKVFESQLNMQKISMMPN